MSLLLLPLFILGCASLGRSRPPSFAMMTYNTGDVDRPPVTAAGIVDTMSRAEWCDLYVLQEVRSPRLFDQVLTLLQERSGRRYQGVYATGTRMAILSVYPIGGNRTIHPKASCPWCGAFAAEVALPGGPVTVVGIHLDPIEKKRDERGHVELGFFSTLGLVAKEMWGRSARSEGIREVLSILRKENANPVLLAGDFNTIPFTRTVRLVERRYIDALHESRDYLKGSYWKVNSPILPRVDFIFHSRDFQVHEAFVLPHTAGDHYPIVATLQL